jgi:hypothetical protein
MSRQPRRPASRARTSAPAPEGKGPAPVGKASRPSARSSDMAPQGARPAGGTRAGGSSPRGPRPAQRLPRALERPWWQGPSGIAAVVIVLAAIVAGIVLVGQISSGTNGSTATAAAATPSGTLLAAVTGVDPGVSASVGTGGLADPLRRLTSSVPALTSGGKPEVVYIGADYCPFCAAQRWSMVVALSRFGTFSNLHLTSSASDDVYPDTSTFSFFGSAYTSKYLTFTSVEETDRFKNAQQTPTAAQEGLITTYDNPPYVNSNVAQGIPFLDLGGRFLAVSSGFLPDVLQGKTADQIGAALANANDPITKGVVGNANYLTAALCQLTRGQPGSVCNAPSISAISAQVVDQPTVG